MEPAVELKPSASSGTDALRSAVVSLQAERGAELWGLARHLGLSVDEADDAVQDTLLRLWSAMRDGKPIERPDAWAFRTLYRSAMDRHRWRRRVRLLAERVGAQPARTTEIDHADRMAVWEAVETLPERQRLAVYLRYRADLPFEEIGQILGIAAPSARSHVSRALDTLRVRLGEEGSR
ncbi:MAG TPA: sigma-70 family RNA polymerase sigma factor [Candidatus Limnocylindria bacterium]|nr:sigma-70 family RNA polymerase sigma factor [Candidatus Limnocylindria bacterium]